jgi:hypothetical protein
LSEFTNQLTPTPKVHIGLLIARGAGYAFGIFLLVWGILELSGGKLTGSFAPVYAFWKIVYGALLLFPYHLLHNNSRLWFTAFLAFVAATVLFVFLTVAAVIFAYIAATEAGEKLGVPGFQGTLIFVFLLQIPVLLFHRRPDAFEA